MNEDLTVGAFSASRRYQGDRINFKSTQSLESDLSKILIDFKKVSIAPTVSPMKSAIREIRRILGCAAVSIKPQESILDLLRRVRATNILSSFQDVCTLCSGITLIDNQDNYCLLKDSNSNLLLMLLSKVDEYRNYNSKYLRLFWGLLQSYFHYQDPEDQDWYSKGSYPPNWIALRSYLKQNLGLLPLQESLLYEWLELLVKNENLFEQNPCDQYGVDLLFGKTQIFEQIQTQLMINDQSWVSKAMIQGQIRSSILMENIDFLMVLEKVILLLKNHPVFADEGLAFVLTRYYKIPDQNKHLELLELAISRWRNPLLEKNKTNWMRVEEPVQEMVRRWIKIQYIQEFFEILTDGAASTDRANFWLQYVNDITDMWFALGSIANSKNRQEIQKIKENMDGRVLKLHSAPENNAFMMKIGSYVFIEFGITGHACYIFQAKSLPFLASDIDVRPDSSGLKNTAHTGYVDKLNHQGCWQEIFKNKISRLTNIQPTRKPESFRTHQSNKTKADPFLNMFSLFKELKEKGLLFEDNRSQGGAFWVKADNTDPLTNLTLQSHGFTYKSGRGWWRDDD